MNRNTLWELFEAGCERDRSKLMIINNGRQFSYGLIFDHALGMAAEIRKWDFKIGGVYLPNSADFVCCLLALNRERKIIVPLNYQLKGESLNEQINYSDIEYLFTDRAGLKAIEKILPKVKLKAIIIIEKLNILRVDRYQPALKEIPAFDDNIFGIYIVTRTHGEYMGVVLDTDTIINNAFKSIEHLKYHDEDVFIATRSFAIADPLVGDLIVPIICGATVLILNDLFHPAILLKAIQEFKATSVLLVGTMLALVLKYPKLDEYDLTCLKKLVFAPITTPRPIVEEVLKKFTNLDIFCIYGLPETPTRITLISVPDIFRFPGSIGKPLEGYEIDIYKPDGSKAGVGEEGVIHIRSDLLMKGYYKRPQLTQKALQNKTFKSWDKGYQNSEGFLYLSGRTDDLLIQGGYEIFPEELKRIMLKNPALKDVSIYGIEDEILVNKVIARVSLKPGSNMDVKEIFQWCRENIEAKKIPKEIRIDNAYKL